MNSPDMNQYITLLFSLLTEFFATQNPSRRRGRPRCYTDASLLVFFAAMTSKVSRLCEHSTGGCCTIRSCCSGAAGFRRALRM